MNKAISLQICNSLLTKLINTKRTTCDHQNAA